MLMDPIVGAFVGPSGEIRNNDVSSESSTMLYLLDPLMLKPTGAPFTDMD